MEIFIVAIVTGLGLIGGIFAIWKGYQPSQVSTLYSKSLAAPRQTKKKNG